MLTPKLVFEDSSFFVFSKPSGWITNEAETTTTQPVLQTYVKENFNFELKGNVLMRDGIVHRLDKETSGLILVAKNEESFISLTSQFKERQIEKKYIALAHGFTEDSGEIKETVGRLPWRRDRFGILPGGRESQTYFKLIKQFENDQDKYSLLELTPKTGRTHQIRIHLKHIGHPIVGDTFYAGRKTSKKDRVWCPRLFLHASFISFYHPDSGTKVSFVDELPQDLNNILEKLTVLS